jgi:hypothetical protein
MDGIGLAGFFTESAADAGNRIYLLRSAGKPPEGFLQGAEGTDCVVEDFGAKAKNRQRSGCDPKRKDRQIYLERFPGKDG